MTSERKIAANRRNSGRSSGPRTAAGKTKVGRNALRHGLAALTHRQALSAAEVERLTAAICPNGGDALLVKEAQVIAETELELRAIKAQKLAAIERLHENSTIAMSKGDNSLALARLRSLQFRLADEQLVGLCARVAEKYKDKLERTGIGTDARFPGGLIPLQIMLLDEFAEAEEAFNKGRANRARYLDQANKLIRERDELQCLLEALPDLVRLARYERRAWSRQKRAIRRFIDIQVLRETAKARAAKVSDQARA
jgi:hypothetical protein